jgi:medium-chain acyl-[acyl-carrier-protein] hydrolase
MEAVPVYQKKYNIKSSDLDVTGKLKLSALFTCFQDIATLHAENLGVGVEKIGQLGLGWVLVRLRVEVLRYAIKDETILIETWYPGPKKFEFERDFGVWDQEGNMIAKAVSSWMIFDVKTRELALSNLIRHDFPPSNRERALECRLGRLKNIGPLELVNKRKLWDGEVDFNGHLNNARYVDFIIDYCWTKEEQRRYQVKEIEINYVSEGLPGDEFLFYRDNSALSSNVIYIEGVHEKDKKVIFKAQLELEDTSQV